MRAVIKRNVSAALAREVLAEAAGCAYCGDRLAALQVEHRRPLARGGDNSRANLVAACISCNTDKRAMLVHEWRAKRQNFGMPWPPLATHAVDPQHYGDDCSECMRGLPDDLVGLPVLAVMPTELVDSRRGLIARYTCPVGHRWTCGWAWDTAYYSDCLCTHCQNLRDDHGEPTYPSRGWYTEVGHWVTGSDGRARSFAGPLVEADEDGTG